MIWLYIHISIRLKPLAVGSHLWHRYNFQQHWDLLHSVIVTIVSTPPKRVFASEIGDSVDTSRLAVKHNTIVKASTFLQVNAYWSSDYVKVWSARVIGGKVATHIHISVPLFGVWAAADRRRSGGKSSVIHWLVSVVLGINGANSTAGTSLIVSQISQRGLQRHQSHSRRQYP